MVTVSVNDITVGVTRDSNQLRVGYSGSLHVYVEDIDDLIDCLEAVRRKLK